MAKKYLKLGNILKRLLFDRDMKPIDLAREVNLPAPTIHRLITGKSTRPYTTSLKPIADYFAITVDQLLGEEALATSEIDKQSRIKNIHHLPLVPWDQLQDNKIEKNKCEVIPFVGIIGKNAYATRLPDYSMEPLFPYGSILIFDPHKRYKDRSYVLVKLHEARAPIFRQLLIDCDNKYLKPLNPDLNAFTMRAVGKNDEIIATLIEARQTYEEQ